MFAKRLYVLPYNQLEAECNMVAFPFGEDYATRALLSASFSCTIKALRSKHTHNPLPQTERNGDDEVVISARLLIQRQNGLQEI